MSSFNARLSTSVCCLAMVGLILGTAAQSIILFLASALALYCIFRNNKADLSAKLWLSAPLERTAFVLYSAFLLWSVTSTLLNPANPGRGLISYLVTGSSLIIVPPLWAYCWRLQTRPPEFWSKLGSVLLAFWTIVAVSQAIIGWQIEGTQLVFNPHFRRARGFYSHPLTFAYVLLVIWPFFLLGVLKSPRSRHAWFKAACIASMIMLSGSRMAQLLLALSAIFAAARLLRGSQRRLAFLLIGVLVVGVAATDNPISRRYRLLLSAEDPDRFSSYPDDRLAFWHAFAAMIEKRPLVGHGIRLNKDYRLPFYKEIGLASFKKPYEAHNQLIQILGEGGLIGLSLFILWIVFLVRSLQIDDPHARRVLWTTLIIFFLAGLTQNAFQDFEVRFALVLMLSLARSHPNLSLR